MTGRRVVFNSPAAEHLAKLCGMIGSAHDDEALTAARMADAHIRQLGLTWSDVICVPEHWRVMARICAERLELFDDKEQRFVCTMAHYRHSPTDKQLDWLAALYESIAERQKRHDWAGIL